ncbi:MAG TPA: ABC transporter ATP-binding protein [Terriglobales bacterium]|nr:ABC transporter ATP-binding protein [Terriglobales bacterium]
MQPIVQVENLSKEYVLTRDSFEQGGVRAALARRWIALKRFGGPQAADESDRENFWALKDVSFNVNEGDVVGIIGRNGAGKSTLLKVISRITDPTEGQVVLRARMASLLEVGTGFHPELTGRENIFLNGAILGMRKAEIVSQFDEIVAFAELEKFLDTPVKHYSSGMHVRLGFAVAAHLNREILIVDEVLAVGDMAFQKKCLGKMSEVSRVGRTVLFVSHNMAAVENLCQRGIVLDGGRIAFEGTSKDAVRDYLGRLTGGRGSSGHVIDLSAATDRRFARTPLLKQLELYTNEDRALANDLQIGARLQLRVHFVLGEPTSNFNVGLGFDNSYGQRVFTAHSQFQPGWTTSARVGPQIFICDIPSLTLTPGEYSLRVWLEIDDAESDLINDAVRLRLIESDYYGTGKVPWNGAFVLEHHWHRE